MPAQKRFLYTFNFNEMQLRLLKYCLLFSLPIIIAYTILELMALNLSTNYKIIGNYLNNDASKIEVMVLGSSQMKNAFNPELSSLPAINFASTSQHHNEDFHILKGTHDRVPNLKYVLLEISYNHLELPHHPNDYWKNTIYLKYYGVNAFERPTWFKDRLLYLSNPRFFSYKLMEQYVHKTDNAKLNKYGFDTNNFAGSFKELNYDKSKIAAHKFRIINREDKKIFKKNTAYLFEMLEYLKSEKLNVVICTVPLYKTYLKERNSNVVRRRDSILDVIKRQYTNVIVLNKEEDILHFGVKDYLNENHLNPDGAKKFTTLVNSAFNGLN